MVIDAIRHADRPSLVVGEPPLGDAMTLVAAGDVTVDGVQPDRDGLMPQVMMDGADGATPRDP